MLILLGGEKQAKFKQLLLIIYLLSLILLVPCNYCVAPAFWNTRNRLLGLKRSDTIPVIHNTSCHKKYYLLTCGFYSLLDSVFMPNISRIHLVYHVI